MVIEKFKCNLQYILPHHLLSRMIAKLADCKVPLIKNWLIKIFIVHYQIDLNSAISADIQDYPTFNHFFTRKLKSSVRPIASEKNAIVSPADGIISQAGQTENGNLFQAKGHFFSLHELMGGDRKLSQPYDGGQFLTIYLAPHDYHRVHMPLDGKLLKTIYVPGKLFSVNSRSVENVPNLFCRNERLICLFDTIVGDIAIILVGAMLVAGIETVWGQKETPCQAKSIIIKEYQDQNIHLAKGAELGRFQFGSTVILLFRPSTSRLLPISTPQQICMGALLGHVIPEGK